MSIKLSTSLLLIFISLSLTACGFYLRGHNKDKVEMAFSSVYLKAGSETAFVADLRNSLIFNGILVEDSSKKATLTLEIISEQYDKQILALSGAGRIREFQLRYRVVLRAYDAQLDSWLPEEEMLILRTLTYDDAQVLAKEQEEALLMKNMRDDAVTQALRRLSRAKPVKVQTP
ncbi:MAG: LPS assembly lipoprotein LptE [Gallionellaceae bacterium]|jgi:LPS-assembly lipoprotein